MGLDLQGPFNLREHFKSYLLNVKEAGVFGRKRLLQCRLICGGQRVGDFVSVCVFVGVFVCDRKRRRKEGGRND